MLCVLVWDALSLLGDLEQDAIFLLCDMELDTSCLLCDMVWDALCLLCDLALEDALCVMEFMVIEITLHNRNLAKKCAKCLS